MEIIVVFDGVAFSGFMKLFGKEEAGPTDASVRPKDHYEPMQPTVTDRPPTV